MCSPYKASPAQITPRPRLLGYFDERVISKVSSFQLTRSARLGLAHRITRIAQIKKSREAHLIGSKYVQSLESAANPSPYNNKQRWRYFDPALSLSIQVEN